MSEDEERTSESKYNKKIFIHNCLHFTFDFMRRFFSGGKREINKTLYTIDIEIIFGEKIVID